MGAEGGPGGGRKTGGSKPPPPAEGSTDGPDTKELVMDMQKRDELCSRLCWQYRQLSVMDLSACEPHERESWISHMIRIVTESARLGIHWNKIAQEVAVVADLQNYLADHDEDALEGGERAVLADIRTTLGVMV